MGVTVKSESIADLVLSRNQGAKKFRRETVFFLSGTGIEC